MSNPLIRSVEHFVLLEPEKEEKIVSKEDAIKWLKSWFQKVNLTTINQNERFEKEEDFSNFLEDACELEVKPGYVIKWFAVRIDPN
tara:strand:- start:10754 stop:11011 length:258 start_codon:yes stop_codon:yes gene_type:complete